MRRQRGVTMIGWIILLMPMAIVLYAAIRVGPEYYEYYKLDSAIRETAKDLAGEESLTAVAIRSALQRRFDSGYVDVKAADLPITRSPSGGWDIAIDYQSDVPLFGNLYLSMDFDKIVTIEQRQ